MQVSSYCCYHYKARTEYLTSSSVSDNWTLFNLSGQRMYDSASSTAVVEQYVGCLLRVLFACYSFALLSAKVI